MGMKGRRVEKKREEMTGEAVAFAALFSLWP